MDAMTGSTAHNGSHPAEKGKAVQADDRTKSHEQFVAEVKAINPTLEVCEHYVSRRTPLKMRCTICFSEWNATPVETLRGRGCARCRRFELDRIAAQDWQPKTMQEAIGMRVKELRRESYLTVETLAQLMGFRSVDIVYRIERGEAGAIASHLKKALKALEVTEEEFYDSPLFDLGAGTGDAGHPVESAVVRRGISSRKTYEAVGARLRKLRKERGIALAKLVEDLEMDRTTYMDYESASDHVSIATLSRIAGYYGMTLSGFFDSPLFGSKGVSANAPEEDA